MGERAGAITFQGNPLTLLGKELKAGDTAPDFEVLGNDLSPVKLSSYGGKVRVISSVPSLDTPVCDMETRRFNSEAGDLGEGRGDPHPQHGPALCPSSLVRSGRRGPGCHPCPITGMHPSVRPTAS